MYLSFKKPQYPSCHELLEVYHHSGRHHAARCEFHSQSSAGFNRNFLLTSDL